MAVKVKATVICDRCQKPFEEKDPDQLPDHKPDPKFALRVNGKEIVEFRDLCPRCDAAVSHFLADICLGEKYEKLLKDVWNEGVVKKEEEEKAEPEEASGNEGTPEEAGERSPEGEQDFPF